jgi:hypothetical protein
MNSKLLCLLMFVLVSQQIKPSLFTSLWGSSASFYFIFLAYARIDGNSHHFVSSVKSALILKLRIFDLQIYRTTLHTYHFWCKAWWRRVYWDKTHKRIWETYRKVTFVPTCIVYLYGRRGLRLAYENW